MNDTTQKFIEEVEAQFASPKKLPNPLNDLYVDDYLYHFMGNSNNMIRPGQISKGLIDKIKEHMDPTLVQPENFHIPDDDAFKSMTEGSVGRVYRPSKNDSKNLNTPIYRDEVDLEDFSVKEMEMIDEFIKYINENFPYLEMQDKFNMIDEFFERTIKEQEDS